MQTVAPKPLAAIIRDEFLVESAIAPAFLGTAVQIRDTLEFDPITKEVETPIHDALGWRYKRFTRETGPNQVGALFLQENGNPWQVKLFSQGKEGGKRTGQYYAPNQAGNRAYLPPVPPEIRQRIADRHGIEVPMEGSFWSWFEKHPQIPLVITEGGKKALAAMSAGHVVMALYGCTCGRSPDIQRFKKYRGIFRQIYVALDRGDTKPKAKRDVQRGYLVLSSQIGAEAWAVDWNPTDGKGIDDLIKHRGIQAFDDALEAAHPLREWGQLEYLKNSLLEYAPTIRVHVEELGDAIDATALPREGIIAIRSAKGTGKTQFLIKHLRNELKVLSLGHRVSLMRALAKQFGLYFRNDLDRAAGMLFDPETGQIADARLALCVDSILAINPEDFRDGVLVLDEGDQVISHLFTSATCNKGGKRGALITRFKEVLQAVRQVIIVSADLTDKEIDYIVQLRGQGDKPWVLENTCHRNSYPCAFIECGDDSAIIEELITAVDKGDRVWVSSDQRGTLQRIARVLKEITPETIVEINGETSSSPDAKAFMATPDQYLIETNAQVVLASPSVPTGLSIQRFKFDKVFGIFYGGALLTKECSQALSRVRQPVPRIVWAKTKGAAYNQISDSTRGFEVLGDLEKKTRGIGGLVSHSLDENIREELTTIDYQTPTMRLFGEIAAEQNFSNCNLRNSLRIRLKHEGHGITRVECHTSWTAQWRMEAASNALKLERAKAVLNAKPICTSVANNWRSRDDLTPEQQQSLDRHEVCDFWVIAPEDLTVRQIQRDHEGKTRSALRRLERFLIPELATTHDVKRIERSFAWKDAAVLPWDFSHSTAENFVLTTIGFDEFLMGALEGEIWDNDHPEVIALADEARHYSRDIKLFLGFTITDKMTNTQIIGELIHRVGLKTRAQRVRFQGDRCYIYELDFEHLKVIQETIAKRTQRREFKGVLPPLYILFTKGVGQFDIASIKDQLERIPTIEPPPVPNLEPIQLAIA